MTATANAGKIVDQLLKVTVAIREVYFGGVDNEQWRFVVIQEKLAIGFVNLLKIGPLNAPFVGDATLLDAGHQHIGGGLQIDDQIGYRCVQGELIVDLLVESHFVIVEIGLGEQAVFLNQEIGDFGRREHIGLLEFVQLLGALHSSDAERKDMLIRQTLSDLRQIVSNPAEDGAVLAQLLADLRREIGDHLEAAGIGMGWQDSGLSAADTPQITLTALQAQTVRALLRETVSNALRHSEARNVHLRFLPLPGERLSLIVEDDGTGTKGDWLRQGSGLSNLRFRVEACGGTLVIEPAQGGTRVRATLPLAGVRAPDTAGLQRAAG